MASNPKISSHLVVKFGYFGLVIFVIISLLYFFKLLFATLIASILLTLLLDPVVNRLETAGFKRINVILGIYVFIVLLAIGTVVFIVPKIINEAQTFANNLPQYKITVRKIVIDIQHTLENNFPEIEIPDFVTAIKERIPGKEGFDIDALLEHLSSFFAIMSLVVIVPIVTFFLLADGHLILKAFLRIIPNSYFEMSALLIHRVTSSLKRFIRGQLIDAAAVGIMTSIFLAIIGLPYFLVIGIIAGLGNLIPYLGPVIGFMPALFVVMMIPGGITVLWIVKIIVVFVVVQFIEGTFVYPIAVGKSVNLHPLVVIIGVTVGGQLGGILGMLIAVPLISIVKVTFEVLYSYLKSYSII